VDFDEAKSTRICHYDHSFIDSQGRRRNGKWTPGGEGMLLGVQNRRMSYILDRLSSSNRPHPTFCPSSTSLAVWTSHKHRAPRKGNYLQYATEIVFRLPRPDFHVGNESLCPRRASLSIRENTHMQCGPFTPLLIRRRRLISPSICSAPSTTQTIPEEAKNDLCRRKFSQL
jgi:hypothetical protein